MEHPADWTCERIILRLELYLVGTVPSGEAFAIAEHIEACAGCAQRLALAWAATDAPGDSDRGPRPRG